MHYTITRVLSIYGCIILSTEFRLFKVRYECIVLSPEFRPFTDALMPLHYDTWLGGCRRRELQNTLFAHDYIHVLSVHAEYFRHFRLYWITALTKTEGPRLRVCLTDSSGEFPVTEYRDSFTILCVLVRTWTGTEALQKCAWVCLFVWGCATMQLFCDPDGSSTQPNQ
jgi:hypothetical protein